MKGTNYNGYTGEIGEAFVTVQIATVAVTEVPKRGSAEWITAAVRSRSLMGAGWKYRGRAHRKLIVEILDAIADAENRVEDSDYYYQDGY